MPQVSEAVLIVLTDWQYRLLMAASKCLSYFIANPKGPNIPKHVVKNFVTIIDSITKPFYRVVRYLGDVF